MDLLAVGCWRKSDSVLSPDRHLVWFWDTVSATGIVHSFPSDDEVCVTINGVEEIVPIDNLVLLDEWEAFEADGEEEGEEGEEEEEEEEQEQEDPQ